MFQSIDSGEGLKFHGSAIHNTFFGLFGSDSADGSDEPQIIVGPFFSSNIISNFIFIEAQISPLHHVALGCQSFNSFKLMAESLVEVTLFGIFNEVH